MRKSFKKKNDSKFFWCFLSIQCKSWLKLPKNWWFNLFNLTTSKAAGHNSNLSQLLWATRVLGEIPWFESSTGRFQELFGFSSKF